MAAVKSENATRSDSEKDFEVTMVGRKDESKEAAIKYKNVQDLVAKICLLGQKRGRPSKDTESLDAAA